MNTRIACSALLLLGGTVFAPTALATNLVVNPSFAGNTNGWAADASTTYDGATDATGVPGSGSARSAFAASGSSTLLALSQCIAAGPGNYTLGGKVLIPNGQAVGGAGVVTVSYFSGPDCSTGFLNFSQINTAITGAFQTLSSPITAPSGTAHIWITGQNQANAAGTHVVNFDDFVLDDGAVPAVVSTPALGWVALLALIAALAAMSAFVLRRE